MTAVIEMPAVSCPACRDSIGVRGILGYARVYIQLSGCAQHLTAWDEADRADRAREERKATR